MGVCAVAVEVTAATPAVSGGKNAELVVDCDTTVEIEVEYAVEAAWREEIWVECKTAVDTTLEILIEVAATIEDRPVD